MQVLFYELQSNLRVVDLFSELEKSSNLQVANLRKQFYELTHNLELVSYKTTVKEDEMKKVIFYKLYGLFTPLYDCLRLF